MKAWKVRMWISGFQLQSTPCHQKYPRAWVIVELRQIVNYLLLLYSVLHCSQTIVVWFTRSCHVDM